MTKMISVKVPDEFYDNLRSYCIMGEDNLAAFCRGIIRHSFLNAMESDLRNLEWFRSMLADKDRYPMTTIERADMETKVAILKAKVERFADIRDDLRSEIYGEEGANA